MRWKCPRADHLIFSTVANNGDYGDWFVAFMLASNLKPNDYKAFLEAIAAAMRRENRSRPYFSYDGRGDIRGLASAKNNENNNYQKMIMI